MQAVTDSTTTELRRRASRTLTSAERDGQQTPIDFSIPQESDISGDLCSSELHSPISMDSSYSEKMFSHSDTNKNNSDISEGCPSPFSKENRLSDSETVNEKISSSSVQDVQTSTSQREVTSVCPPLREDAKESTERALRKSREKRLNEAKRFAEISNEDNDESDQQQMADIVGDASSPGEFLDHALEFIKGGRKSDRECWPENDRKKSRSPEINCHAPASKRRKESETQGDAPSMYGLGGQIPRCYKEGRSDVKREEAGGKSGFKNSALTPDQKFFVEAFKIEVASAAENAAEASALRLLEILEGSGIYFGRSPFKSDQCAQSNFWGGKRPTESACPSLDDKRNSGESHPDYINTPPRLIPATCFSEDKDDRLRTSNRSQLCFGSVRMNDDGKLKSRETIDLTNVRRGSCGTSSDSKRNDLVDGKRHVDSMKLEEQSQALSLVTKRSKSPTSTSSIHESNTDTRISQNHFKPTSSTGASAFLSPFVRQSISSGTPPFIPPLASLPLSSPFGGHFDNSANPLNKFFFTGVPNTAEKRARTFRDDMSEQATEFSPFSFAAASSLKTKSSSKSRVSPLYKDDILVSPRRDDKKQRPDLALSSSIGLHGMPSTSAFARHGSRLSPTPGGMRSLRSSGSPDRKPFAPPGPLNHMYPFGVLPFLPGVHQNPHFAASLLASMNQRRNMQGDYNDIRNGSNIHGDRLPGVHQSLRAHPSSFMGDHHAYEVDGSSYAFPNNMQEGLTPQHLKKAKLIFFYTRYPNANTLKTYFPDVNFSRAITSQLIKWFSNFREFFYIQMEKFARQAATDGVNDASRLRVTRDSEVFRVLNLHYNKCNEFFVPEAFVRATEASQHEFFIAVKAGKDSDPAWKKVIYKVICKFDSDIPDIFKTPNVLDNLHKIRD